MQFINMGYAKLVELMSKAPRIIFCDTSSVEDWQLILLSEEHHWAIKR